VSTLYEETGRTNQKRRTREALVAAARDIVASGRTPSVEEAARAAAISRTTAYRYFPTQHALLSAAHPETAKSSLLPKHAPEDPVERLDLVLRSMIKSNLQNEAQQRTMLRLSLEATPAERADLPLRQGRAIKWIDEALSPLRGSLPDRQLRDLTLSIRASTGIEALVWLVDVGGLTPTEAGRLLRRTGVALLEHAIMSVTPKNGDG